MSAEKVPGKKGNTDAVQLHFNEDGIEIQTQQGPGEPFTEPKPVQSASEIPWWVKRHIQAYDTGEIAAESSPLKPDTDSSSADPPKE